MKYQKGEASEAMIAVVIVVAIIAIIGLLFFGLPVWNVWRAGLSGESELKQAEWNRQIAVREAQAQLDSSKLKALSEIERAKGNAEANRIIAGGLGGPEGYLRYLYIDALSHNKNMQIIYVPTEANLPILEASRHK
jgi:type II secretory pathway pseudopilin PulG